MRFRPIASRLIILCLIFGFTFMLWAAPAGPEGYLYLGKEGETVLLKERSSVAYGANGTFVYKHNVDAGRVELSNATFGDPLPGVPKFGFYKPGSSTEFSESEILKTFPLVKPDLIRSMLLARPGVKVEGNSDQPEKMRAIATIDGATVEMHIVLIGEEFSSAGQVRTIAFSYANSSKQIVDIWSNQEKVKKIFETFLSPQLAQRMLEAWSRAKQSYEGVEFGRNAQQDIYRRTGLTPANARQPEGYIEFSRSSAYESARPVENDPDSQSEQPSHFEIRRGIARPFTVFMIHSFSPEGDIAATQQALKAKPTRQEVQESQKPYAYGKVEKRRLKADPRMQYYIYVPAGYKPEKTYDLILTFHGDGGSGRFFANAFAGMAQKDNFIVLSPNYDHSGERDADFDQMEAGDASLMFENEIREHFKLNPKTYLVSFSAGGLYAYVYANNHPDRVAAFTSNSTSWTQLPGAGLDRDMPTLVTCGLADERSEGAQSFYEEMRFLNFKKLEIKLFPKIGHQFSPAHVKAVTDFFLEVQRDKNKSYLKEYSQVFQQISMQDLAGNYKRISAGRVQSGSIYYDEGKRQWRWQSKEGGGAMPPAEYDWSLKPALDQEKLLTGDGNPYTNPKWYQPEDIARASYFLILLKTGPRGYLPRVAGFVFNGDIYEKL